MDLKTRAEIEKAWCRTGRAADFATESEFDAALDEETKLQYPNQMSVAYRMVRRMLDLIGNNTSMIRLVSECRKAWTRGSSDVLRRELEGYVPNSADEPFDFAFERTAPPPYEALAAVRFDLEDSRVVNELVRKYGPPPEDTDLEIVELVGRLWGHRGELFGSIAESFLLQERAEGLALPRSPHDDVIPALTLAVTAIYDIEMLETGRPTTAPEFVPVMQS